jgi:hypothetical protein
MEMSPEVPWKKFKTCVYLCQYAAAHVLKNLGFRAYEVSPFSFVLLPAVKRALRLICSLLFETDCQAVSLLK